MPPSVNNVTHQQRRTLPAPTRSDENSPTNSSNTKAIACCLVKSCPAGNLPFADLTQATTFIDFAPCTILILPCMATAKTVREARAVAELRNILQQEATLLDKRGLSVWRLRLDALTVIGKMSQLGFRMAEFGVNAVDGVHTWNMVCSDSTAASPSASSSASSPLAATVSSSSSTSNLHGMGSSAHAATATWGALKGTVVKNSSNDLTSLFNANTYNAGSNSFNASSVTNYDIDTMPSFNTTIADNDYKSASRLSTAAGPLDSSYNFLAAPLDDAGAPPVPSTFSSKPLNEIGGSSTSKSGSTPSMAPPLFLGAQSFASPAASSSPSIHSNNSQHGTRSNTHHNMPNTQHRDPNKHLLSNRNFGVGTSDQASMAPQMNMFGGGQLKRTLDEGGSNGGVATMAPGGSRRNAKHKNHSKSRSKRLRRAVYQSVKVSSALLQTHGTSYLPDELKEPSVEFTPLLKRIQAWLEVHPECELRPKWVSVHPEGHKQCSAHFKCATWPCTLKEKDASDKPDFRCPARIAVARDKITGMYRVHYEMITHEGHGNVSGAAANSSTLTNDAENENDYERSTSGLEIADEDDDLTAAGDDGNDADDDDDAVPAGTVAVNDDDFMPSMSNSVYSRLPTSSSSLSLLAGNGPTFEISK